MNSEAIGLVFGIPSVESAKIRGFRVTISQVLKYSGTQVLRYSGTQVLEFSSLSYSLYLKLEFLKFLLSGDFVGYPKIID